MINSGKSEEPKKGLYFGGDRPKPPGTIHRWQVFCLDLNTGKRMWRGDSYGFGQLLLVDDLLLIQAEMGEVALVEANPAAFHEL